MSMDTTSSILVVWDSNTENRFSGYITEILYIEGYNWFEIHDLSSEPLSPQTPRLVHEEALRQLSYLHFSQTLPASFELHPPGRYG